MLPSGQIIVRDGMETLEYMPSYFDSDLFRRLQNDIPWVQRQIRMFGKAHNEPRLTAWFGPAYAYSGVEQKEADFPDFVEEIRIRLCMELNFPFNGVLLNYYRNGHDYMGWHRDNEKSMDQRCIASASFGASRKFSVRHIQSKEKKEITLESGSLLLMHNFQTNWQHALPKSLREHGERINLTFRHILY